MHRWPPGLEPGRERSQSRLGDEVHGPVVDGYAAVDVHGVGAQQMGVGVGRARHLPQAKAVVVGLSRRIRIEQAGHVGLRLHVDHGGDLIGAEDLRRPRKGVGDARVLAGAGERQPRRPAAVHEEGVEFVGQGLHAVVVGHQGEGRLGLPGGDEPPRLQCAQAATGADGAGHLREDVEREAVAGELQRAIAGRVDLPKSLAGHLRARPGHGHENRPTHDADLLCRHTHPGIALADDLLGEARPLRIGVDAATHVEPLDDDGPAEARRVRGVAHQHAGPVGGTATGGERPATVAGHGALGAVRRRGSRRHVFVLDVAGTLEVDGDRLTDERPGSARQLV